MRAAAVRDQQLRVDDLPDPAHLLGKPRAARRDPGPAGPLRHSLTGLRAWIVALVVLLASDVVRAPVAGAVVTPVPPSAARLSDPKAVDHTGRFLLVGYTGGAPQLQARVDRLTGDEVTLPMARLASGDLRYAITSVAFGQTPQWWSIDEGSGVPIAAPPAPWGPVVEVQLSRDGQTLIGSVEGPSPTIPGTTRRTAVAVTRSGSVTFAPIVPSAARAISPSGRYALIDVPCRGVGDLSCSQSYRWDLATATTTRLTTSLRVLPFAVGDDGAVIQSEFLGDPFTTGGSTIARRDVSGARTVLVDAADSFQKVTASQDASAVALIDNELRLVAIDALTGDRSRGERIASTGFLFTLTGDGAWAMAFDQAADPTLANLQVVATPGHTGAPRLRSDETFALEVAGLNGVPPTATAVALNVTVTNPRAAGYATVWPCDAARPVASNVNFVAGRTVANAVVAQLASSGPDAGSVCFASNTAVDLVVDVQGWFTGSAYRGITPDRFLDTRAGETDAVANLNANAIVRVLVSGVRAVPGDATAAAVNVTVTNPATAGFATVWPCDSPRPEASNINFVAGQTVANAVIAQLASSGPDTGSFCLASNTSVDLVVDVQGSFSASTYTGISPDRFLDTRSGETDSVPNLALGVITRLPVAGAGSIPADATSVVLNVTVTNPAAAGFATVWPCDAPRPVASNVNFVAGQTVPNAVIARVSSIGEVCLAANQPADLVVDVQGSFSGSTYTGAPPVRFLDTRD